MLQVRAARDGAHRPLHPRHPPRGQDGLRLHHHGRHTGEVLRRRASFKELQGKEVLAARSRSLLGPVQLAKGQLITLRNM